VQPQLLQRLVTGAGRIHLELLLFQEFAQRVPDGSSSSTTSTETIGLKDWR